MNTTFWWWGFGGGVLVVGMLIVGGCYGELEAHIGWYILVVDSSMYHGVRAAQEPIKGGDRGRRTSPESRDQLAQRVLVRVAVEWFFNTRVEE